MPDLAAAASTVCVSDRDCASRFAHAPRCDHATGLCNECLPGATDSCAAGLHCVFVGGGDRCVPICRVDADCAGMGPGFGCCFDTCLDLATDVDNCGGCGKICPLARTERSCVAGACLPCFEPCSPGYTDCDKDCANGCEINTDSNPLDCGTCGNVCPSIINGAGVCKAGQCSVACKQMFGDCNKDASDGCETDISLDVLNCGACKAVVPPAANATPFCDNGAPSFRCLGHYFDCNADPKDGCEINAATDVNNCGHCGNACTMNGVCKDGACVR